MSISYARPLSEFVMERIDKDCMEEQFYMKLLTDCNRQELLAELQRHECELVAYDKCIQDIFQSYLCMIKKWYEDYIL